MVDIFDHQIYCGCHLVQYREQLRRIRKQSVPYKSYLGFRNFESASEPPELPTHCDQLIRHMRMKTLAKSLLLYIKMQIWVFSGCGILSNFQNLLYSPDKRVRIAAKPLSSVGRIPNRNNERRLLSFVGGKNPPPSVVPSVESRRLLAVGWAPAVEEHGVVNSNPKPAIFDSIPIAILAY